MELGDRIPAQFLELGGVVSAYRNKIISGKMEITQRGVSFPAANGYTLDRWQVLVGGGGVVTTSQQADAPPSNEFRTSLRVAVTTADTNIAASDYAIVIQKVEGYNARDLIGRTSTLSFWVRSPKVGVHCVAFRNATPDRSYVLEYTVTAPNTWEYKTVTLPGGLITEGAWDWTNGAGLDVVFVLAAGTAFRTAVGAWRTGNFLATANQVNCLDTVGHIFAITGVQLEVGSVATLFEHRAFISEVVLCLRYYEPISTFAQSSGTGFFGGAQSYLVAKRAPPTLALTGFNPTNCANFSFQIPAFNTLQWGWNCQATVGSGSFLMTGTASAEL